jgi:tRNA(Ile)-lysidine synthetase-like protein
MSHLLPPPHVGLEQRLIARFADLDVPRGSTVCLGFSGGTDSLALAIALSRIKLPSEIHPVLIHIDHRLRSASGHDAARSQQLAAAMGLPIFLEALSDGVASRATGVGIEEQARRERYLALSRHWKNLNARLLLTAHHLDDQSETVLMHMFRGAGTRGAVGMRDLTILQIPWWEQHAEREVEPLEIPLWRPLLHERKRTLEDYVAASGLEPVMDESNTNLEFRRNAVRHEVIPMIEKRWPGSIEAIGRLSRSLAMDDDLLTILAADGAKKAITEDGALNIDALHTQHTAVSRRIVREWLRGRGVQEPTLERTMAILGLAEAGSESTVLEVGENRCVARLGQTLRAGTRSELVEHAMASVPGLAQQADSERGSIHPVSEGEGRTFCGRDWTLHYTMTDHPDGRRLFGFNGRSVPMRCDPAGLRIEVRAVRDGDRWLQSGAPVRESLRAAGVHPLARDTVVCVVSGKDVLFIPNIEQPDIRDPEEWEPAAWLNLQWKKS